MKRIADYVLLRSGQLAFFLFLGSGLGTILFLFLFDSSPGWIQTLFVFSTGLLIGWLISKYGQRQIKLKQLDAKYPLKQDSKVFNAIFMVLRKVVFEHNYILKNHVFLVNILTKDGRILIQLIHRAQIPQLCRSVGDTDFGIAIRIPLDKLDLKQRRIADQIIKEENSSRPIEKLPSLWMIDIGEDIRDGSYLITRVLREIYRLKEGDVVIDYEKSSDQGSLSSEERTSNISSLSDN